ncbi:MAG: very short patch repair endonuclease [Bacillaceae bacterium]|nr:very short patch repair endonuclease [Bacillaceae bacterium]
MVDNLTPAQRRKNMQAIKSKSKLEEIVSKELWKRGIRYRRNVKTLKGKPDIAIKKYKVVVFIDSCFWHGCPIHGNIPKTNRDYWVNKITRNKERDESVNAYYLENSWNVMRVWEHEIKEDLNEVVDRIESFVLAAKETIHSTKESSIK